MVVKLVVDNTGAQPPEKYMAACACGCYSFVLLMDGSALCSFCGAPLRLDGVPYVLDVAPMGAAPPPEPETKITNVCRFDEEAHLADWLEAAKSAAYLIAIAESGRVNVFGTHVESPECKSWLRKRFRTAFRLFTYERT